MTGKRNESGGKAKNAQKPESKPDETATVETQDSVSPDAVIDAEFSESDTVDASTEADAKPEEKPAEAEAEAEPEARDKSAETAAGVAALALAAGAADKQEAERNAAALAEDKRGPGGLVYGWLALLTLCVVAGLYMLIVNPTYLRDRMGLADSPELLAQASATREAGKAAESNAASITANEATIAETQSRLDETEAEAKAASASALKAISLAEAAQTIAGAPAAGLKATVEKLEANLASVRAALVKSNRAAAAGDPIDGLALAAAAETADAALVAAVAADSKATAAAADLGGRLDTISAQLATLGEQVAALEAKASKRGPVSLAEAILALQDLRTGVASGKPFATLLGRAQAALPDAAELKDAPWVGFANAGLPTEAALTAEMQAHALGIAQDKLKARLNTGEDSWLDRAVGGVVGRLKVRRVGAGVEGDDPASVAARAEAALQEGNIAKAIQEVEALEGEGAARFAEWLKKAKATAAATNDLDAVQKAAIAAADGA